MHRRRLLGGLAGLATSGARSSPTHRVEPGDSLARALGAAMDGDTVELQAGEHAGQAAVLTHGSLTLRGHGGRAVLQADGAHAEGKAILVVRGGRVLIEDIEFRGARVPHGNGAGIRFERGQLTLRRCRFVDNEMGLLSADRADAELVIEDCEFGDAPRHEGPLHHLLYVGAMRSLSLSGSRFWNGWRGHLVKSRAAVNRILCNQLIDGIQGEASYEIDLPNGGLAWVIGNVIARGPRPQNVALLAYGAEGRAHAACALRISHNSFVNDGDSAATFVRPWPDRLPADSVLQQVNNLFVGRWREGDAPPAGDGNRWRPLDQVDRDQWPPRVLLRAEAPPLDAVAAAPEAEGLPLAPRHAIAFPLGMRALAPRDHWRPGAFQPD
ncbi:MAG: hypothetical protein JNM08_00810 [Rubrivivax sp.]|nr:hypothetical protein [Rubrivivax sp.]